MSDRGSGAGGVSDLVMLGLIAVALGVIGVVWLWGGVAGVLFGGGWPRIGFGELATVLLRLPDHLRDPAQAWPALARAQMPGASGFYLALALVAALATVTGIIVARLLPGLSAACGTAEDGGARWARSSDLRVLWASRRARNADNPARLALGYHGRRLLHAEQRHALVAFGPPQSGKSAGLAIPALLEWDGPAVASSIKTDLLGATLRRRQQLGEALVFDPFGLAGVPTHTWSPLHGAQTWDGALEAAWRLAAAGELDQRGVEGGDFWAVAAEQRLAPLLYAAARSGSSVERVVAWAYGQSPRELDRMIEACHRQANGPQEQADAQSAYDAVRAFESQADRTRSSIEATVQALLRAYRFARVLRSAQGCEITPERLLSRSSTLYLIGDPKASKLLRPIFLALLSEVVDRAYELANQHGGRLQLPLLVCLDEAGNVAPLPNLAEVASTAPSHNIQLISIFHDLAQARSRYGGQAETVVNSHRARVLLPGVADLGTLRYFSDLIGEQEQREQTRTIGTGGTTRSIGRRRRPLVAAEALRQLPDGHALLLYGRLAPVRVRLRMWFSDPKLRRLREGS